MDPLDELLARIGDDPEDRRNAAIEFAMMLEESSRHLPADPDDEPRSALQRELAGDPLRPWLGRDEQYRIVDELAAWIEEGDISADFFWAIGKAMPDVSAAPLLRAIGASEGAMDDATRRAALESLHGLLRMDAGAALDDVVQALRHDNPLPFAMACQESADEEMQALATQVVALLGRYRHV